ncbi:MAG: cupin domain-containing protein [Fimbriimonadaceae bacterium]
MNLILKRQSDIMRQMTVTCGEVDMILGTKDYDNLNVAVCPNIKPTIGHYHPLFDEIYFVLDGWIELKTYDPTTDTYAENRLESEELALIPAGMHHKVTAASDTNRLCVLMIPGFLGEVPSDKL